MKEARMVNKLTQTHDIDDDDDDSEARLMN